MNPHKESYFAWVTCPRCEKKLFKDYGKQFDVAIFCRGCKQEVRVKSST